MVRSVDAFGVAMRLIKPVTLESFVDENVNSFF